MIPFQVQLETVLASFQQVATVMQMRWAWPLAESAHFIGLTLLFGPIVAWDLRLLGLLKGVPAIAFHRLVPFAVVGFVINVTTGCLFLMTYPDQYVYNSAFHLKMLCLLLAGANVAAFYLTMFRRVTTADTGTSFPVMARLAGAISIALWLTVIVSGRMITFFRPSPCGPGPVTTFIASCIVR